MNFSSIRLFRRFGFVLCAFTLLLAVVRPGTSSDTNTLAEVKLAPIGQSHFDTDYVWLADSSLQLTVDLPADPDHTLELLWGSKGKDREATIRINDQSRTVKWGGYKGFRWKSIDIPEDVSGDRYQIVLLPKGSNPAFVSAARLTGTTEAIQTSELPLQMNVKLGRPLQKPHLTNPLKKRFAPTFERADHASKALSVCDRFVEGWLTQASDPDTGLIPDELDGDESDEWWPEDAGADNWSFMVLSSALTNRTRFNVRMKHMLDAERQVTRRLDALSDVYSFRTDDFVFDTPELERLIFGSSEYAKDGLLPITNWLGTSPWSRRMIAINNSIWKHAPVNSAYGKLPSRKPEVNGEMMQVTPRLYWMTGNEKYLDRAIRLADWYLLNEDNHPTKDNHKLYLRDHGNEVVSGLSEVYFAAHHARPEKAERYRMPMHAMLDRILEIGVNEHGLLYGEIDPVAGNVTWDRIIDTWGYNLNAFYTVYMVDGTERYRNVVRKALGNLNEHYRDTWTGDTADMTADALESALYLYNREPVESVKPWMDQMAQELMKQQGEDGIIEGWHGDGNTARTLMMYALWKQQGVTIQPWRRDVKVGAVTRDDKLYLTIKPRTSWDGKLVLDQPRHRTVMNMPADYPRINQFPEWFTAEPGQELAYRRIGTNGTHSGTFTAPTLDLKLDRGQVVHLVIKPE